MDENLARKVIRKKAAPNPLNPFSGAGEGLDDEEEAPSPQDLVDFSAVYRCLHINSVLVTTLFSEYSTGYGGFCARFYKTQQYGNSWGWCRRANAPAANCHGGVIPCRRVCYGTTDFHTDLPFARGLSIV